MNIGMMNIIMTIKVKVAYLLNDVDEELFKKNI